MKLFSFINYYLSSIQQGIQTMHAALDMAVKYRELNSNIGAVLMPVDYFWQWAEEEKTVVLLNGGNHEDLRNFKAKLGAREATGEMRYPWGYFYEDKASMNGMLTCVAIILPDSLTKYRRAEDAYADGIEDTFDIELIHKINTSRKAI